MIEIQMACHFLGVGFSPQVVMNNTGLHFSKYQEVGSIETVGPHKGKPAKIGSATLFFQDVNLSGSSENDSITFVETLLRHIEIIREYGAEDIYLDLSVYYKIQCNMSFEPELLKKISELEIPLNISCYDITDE